MDGVFEGVVFWKSFRMEDCRRFLFRVFSGVDRSGGLIL